MIVQQFLPRVDLLAELRLLGVKSRTTELTVPVDDTGGSIHLKQAVPSIGIVNMMEAFQSLSFDIGEVCLGLISI